MKLPYGILFCLFVHDVVVGSTEEPVSSSLNLLVTHIHSPLYIQLAKGVAAFGLNIALMCKIDSHLAKLIPMSILSTDLFTIF